MLKQIEEFEAMIEAAERRNEEIRVEIEETKKLLEKGE